jgi:thioredoxin reductase (NADPH)
MTEYDVLIIGGGPAGFTAGIYASRANFSVLLLEGDQPGGQLTTTTEVENFPGFPKGIMGPQLMSDMREQTKRFGAETKFEMVTAVDFSKRPFVVSVGSTQYTAKTVIIATGARAKYLGLESEERLKGRGVSACATCDGFFFKDKELVVVGGGDTAMEEANFLTKFASKVTLLNRTQDFKASDIMVKRAMDNPKIQILKNVQVVQILGDTAVTGVVLENTQTKEQFELKTDGVFIAIGRQPNTDIFKNVLEVNSLGQIVTQAGTTKTSIPGVFAAGDVADVYAYWQAVVAAGDGCKAALDAQRFIEEDNE